MSCYSFFLSLASIFVFLQASVQPFLTLLKQEMESFDLEVDSWFQSYTSKALQRLMRIASLVGEAPVVIGLTLLAAGLLLLAGARREALAICTLTVTSSILSGLSKLLFRRPRPIDEGRRVRTIGTSFPSGHTLFATAFFFLLAVILCLRVDSPYRWLIVIAALLFVLLVGISRIYLGAHFASDVLAGFALGGVIALVIGLSFRIFTLPLGPVMAVLLPIR